MEKDIFNGWSVKINRPLLIAGPCSAESFSQLKTTVSELINLNVDFFRAGVWKPRSRPGAFEGKGSEALKWINKIKEEYKVKFIVEVATPSHVEEVLKEEIDGVWIGARTTVNPFLVQVIADTLKGTSIPVFIKNPINPDISLWRGAIERMYEAGISNVAAIHRGFSQFQKSKFRNEPMWRIPIELKSKMPELPLICDPSHISGNREMIREISQKALDLNYDGLMIEAHIKPEKALSDPMQQVTPSQLKEILEVLHIKYERAENQLFMDQLEELREKIDQIDREIIENIATRMRIVDKIGEYKKENNVTVFQLKRWKEILETRPEWAQSLLLNPSFVEEIYKLIHNESIRIQTNVMKDTKAESQ